MAGASRPYQTVVFFPHSGARIARSTADMDMSVVDIVVRSGRALDWLDRTLGPVAGT